MFRIFTPLFETFDTVIAGFASTVSSQVMVAVTPVLRAALILWVVGWGLLIMSGTVHQPVREFLRRLLRNGVILTFATSAGYYQGTVAELVRTVPDDLASVILGAEPVVGPGLDPTGAGSALGALIDRAAGQGLAAANDTLAKGGLLTEDGIVFYTFGVLLLLSTVALVSVGGAILITAKLVLGILVALGPLFIAALLFAATRRFFERWTAMVVTYGLLVVLFAALFTFLLGVYGHYMTRVRLDGSVNAGYAVAGALILSVVSILVLREVKPLAIGLASGVTLPALTRGWWDQHIGPGRGG